MATKTKTKPIKTKPIKTKRPSKIEIPISFELYRWLVEVLESKQKKELTPKKIVKYIEGIIENDIFIENLMKARKK